MRGRTALIDPAIVAPTVDEPADGRHRRSMSSQRRIVQAMLELVAEGNIAPSADEVSDRAGVGRWLRGRLGRRRDASSSVRRGRLGTTGLGLRGDGRGRDRDDRRGWDGSHDVA